MALKLLTSNTLRSCPACSVAWAFPEIMAIQRLALPLAPISAAPIIHGSCATPRTPGTSAQPMTAAAVIGWADVPGVRGVAQEPWMIGAAEIGAKGSARRCIAIISGKAQATEHAGQERKVLDVSSFKAIDPSAAGVERLCHHGIGRKTRTCCRRIAGVCDNGVR